MSGSGVYPSLTCQRGEEDCSRFRILRVSPISDQFFQPLKGHFHWNHFTEIPT